MTAHPEYVYLNLLEKVLTQGVPSEDRTGNGTLSLFGEQMRFKIYPHFPLLTTKKVYWKGVVHELLWFLSGDTNIKYLVDNNVNIWNDDAYRFYLKNPIYPNDGPYSKDEFVAYIRAQELNPRATLGSLGPVYGKQWRKFCGQDDSGYTAESTDQIKEVIEGIKTNPYSRRHIVNAWNATEIKQCALPPCHYSFQFYVRNRKLSCLANIRSNDLFLGSPFNIASYALLTYMVAQVCELEPHELIISIGDAHIYNGHIEAVKKQLRRQPKQWPTVTLDPTVMDIDNFKYEHIRLFDYDPHSTIKAPLFT